MAHTRSGGPQFTPPVNNKHTGLGGNRRGEMGEELSGGDEG